jgi:hypothetical protein
VRLAFVEGLRPGIPDVFVSPDGNGAFCFLAHTQIGQVIDAADSKAGAKASPHSIQTFGNPFTRDHHEKSIRY